jgi:hypothetical protein
MILPVVLDLIALLPRIGLKVELVSPDDILRAFFLVYSLLLLYHQDPQRTCPSYR